ncbi:MAG: PAS domain S-box protein [Spirochaetia bacterium]|jgi:PAS domain S-box-containing protein
MKRKIMDIALRVTITYAILASLWIVLSDRTLALFVMPAQLNLNFQTYKGLAFVLVTALLLFMTLRNQLRKWESESTGRRQAEEALEEQEKRYRLLLHNLAMGVVVVDTAEKITFANPASEMIFAASKMRIIGMNLRDFMSEEEFSHIRRETARRSRGETSTYEVEILRLDGKARHLLVTATPQYGSHGEFAGALATFQDITEQTLLKQQVEEERGQLLTLINNLPDYVSIKDTESRVLITNSANARVMGLERAQDAVGKSDLDFYPRSEAARYIADERMVIQTGTALINKEEESVDQEGQKRWTLTTKVPLRNAQGKVMGIVCTGRDITEHHQIEEKLRRSEQRYRDLLEQAADGIFLLDENMKFIMANSELCKMLGYAREELLRLSIQDTYPDELRDDGRVRFERISSSEKLRFERLMKRKDGSFFPVEISAGRLSDGTQQAIARDITERKRRESELALERSLLSALMENIPDKIYFKDVESRFIRGSRAHAKICGLNDASEMIGKTDMDFFSEEHAQQAYEDEQRIIRTGEPILNEEEKETWPDRPDTWVLTTKMPLRDQEGNIIGTFGISRDITERKQAEERLLSLARFPDESPQPVMRVAADGSVIYANKASEPMMSSWAGGADRKIPGEHLPALALAWESGKKQEIEIRQASRSYAVAVVPFPGVGYINLYGRDVTEERSLAERLTQAQKIEAIGQLAGGIAHDFNNILQAIMGYCEVLKQELPEKNQQYVAEIIKAAKRAAALTAQLLEFSRRQILRPRIVNAKDLVRSMQKMLEMVIGEDIELRTFIDPDTGNFLADPGQIEQVLLNLTVNSRDAMPSGGKLTLETSNRSFDEAYVRDHPGAKTGQYVRIAVSDTGVGMDQETLSHMYEPFFTTKEIGKGTGLGLSTVYGIVKQSEGYINCYSEPGKGTTFTIYLPLTLEEADRPLTVASGTTAPRGTETILIVDDDSAVRSTARLALEGAGYSVIEAPGGTQALSDVSARRIRVELLVTDVVMPQLSGKELARKLQVVCPGVRVLYVSGYTANVISHHGILEAGLDFLQKPFSSKELLSKVREILDRP